MTLPTTYSAALLLMIFSLICYGSWANSIKLAGKWRFELFYFDFSVGLMLTAAVLALTLGTLGSDGFVFLDDFMHAGRRNMAYGFGAGVIFNFGNLLLVAAMTLAGMSVAFPIGLGLALVIGAILSHIVTPQGNPILVFAGAAMVVLAIILDAVAYRSFVLLKEVERMKAGQHRTLRPSASWKAVLLSLGGGVLIGSLYPLVELARAGDAGLGPYALGFMFCLGMASSTVVYNLYFMNLPVQGPPIEMRDYFHGTPRQHLFGFLGGVIWCAGAIGYFVVASAPSEVQATHAVNYALSQSYPLLTALWGLLAWKEFQGAGAKAKALLVLMFFLFLAGLGLVAVSPLYTGL